MATASPAEYYREKAVELRKLASGMTAANAQKEFEMIAKLYDRLAKQIEGTLDERKHQSAAY
jgi:hypothetical protein